MQIDPHPVLVDLFVPMSVRHAPREPAVLDDQSFTARRDPVSFPHLGLCGFVVALIFTVGILIR